MMRRGGRGGVTICDRTCSSSSSEFMLFLLTVCVRAWHAADWALQALRYDVSLDASSSRG
eukprot:6860938-Prymnesium_polylepis.3